MFSMKFPLRKYRTIIESPTSKMPLYLTLKISDVSFITAYLAPRVEEETERTPETKANEVPSAASNEIEGDNLEGDEAEGEIEAEPLKGKAEGEARSA